MKKILISMFLLGSVFSYAQTAKILSPACQSKEDVGEFVKIWTDTNNLFSALSAKRGCMIMTKGAEIKSVLDTSWGDVKVLWVDLGGHDRIGWVLREAVY